MYNKLKGINYKGKGKEGWGTDQYILKKTLNDF